MLVMHGETVAEVCGNCGAPLELDENGRCSWCHATLKRASPNVVFGLSEVPPEFRGAVAAALDTGSVDQARLVPDGVDDCETCAPFVFLTLALLGSGLSLEPAVQAYTCGQPGLLRQIRQLSTAVSEAGVRVRDAGLLEDSFDCNLKVYAPEEIWIFDLAVDVIAMLGSLDGLPRAAQARFAAKLRTLDTWVDERAWKKGVKKAGEGPAAFRGLRASVRHHTPHPAR